MKQTPRTRAVICLGLLAVAIFFWNEQRQLKQRVPDAYRNTGGAFTLESSNGPFSLADWQGKIVLLYFGYTHCPDKCPVTLANWGAAFKKLPGRQLKYVGGILITVDPQRDTVAHLQAYTARFHPNIIGLTGDEKVLRAVALKYRADFDKDTDEHRQHTSISGMVVSEKTQMNHPLVNHTSFIYVIGMDGRVKQMLPYNAAPGKILQAIKRQL